MGGESGGAVWMGGLEYVGHLPGNGRTPGLFVSDGDNI